MLSASMKILWALLMVELYVHDGLAGTVKIGKNIDTYYIHIIKRMYVTILSVCNYDERKKWRLKWLMQFDYVLTC